MSVAKPHVYIYFVSDQFGENRQDANQCNVLEEIATT